MKHIMILLLAGCLCLSSCSTVFKRSSYKLPVRANIEGSVLVYQDSTYALPATITVRRSKQPLPLKIISDSGTRAFAVQAAPHTTFLFVNFCGGVFAPAGWLVDLTNPKRFYYGNKLNIDACDTATIIRLPWAAPKIARAYHSYTSKRWPVRQGDVALRIALPWVNDFYLQPDGEGIKHRTGTGGLAAGIEYAHRDHQFLRLAGGLAANMEPPAPIGFVDYFGMYERMSTRYVEMSNNHQLGRFLLGYGLSYSENSWARRIGKFGQPPGALPPAGKSSHSLGFTLSGHYQLGRHFQAGMLYRPTVVSLAPPTRLKYEHVISAELGWSFRVRRHIKKRSGPLS